MLGVAMVGIIMLGMHLTGTIASPAFGYSHASDAMINIPGTTLQAVSQPEDRPIHILFFGDSITAGYEIGTQAAFPALIGAKMDSLGKEVRVVNAGLSGETSAGGLRRVDWILRQPVDIFVLELGGNDGLRGIDPAETKRNLQGIIEKVRTTKPDAQILLTGMEAPPNMGQAYTKQFRSLYNELAEESRTPLMPFILDGVAGDPSLNLPDGIHPTEEGHRIIARNLLPYLLPMVEKHTESQAKN